MSNNVIEMEKTLRAKHFFHAEKIFCNTPGYEYGEAARKTRERGLRKIDCNRRGQSTSGEDAKRPQGDFME